MFGALLAVLIGGVYYAGGILDNRKCKINSRIFEFFSIAKPEVVEGTRSF